MINKWKNERKGDKERVPAIIHFIDIEAR